MVYVLIKSLLEVLLKSGTMSKQIYLKNYASQLLENLKNVKYTHLLKTIFGVLI